MANHVQLIEYAAGQHPARRIVVDREKCEVHNVKFLGENSKNSRDYPLATRQRARGLYEGCHINFDHPSKPTDPRPFSSRFGIGRNIVVEDAGTFGTVRYNPKHPSAEAFLWFCENEPDAVGMSHNAIGREGPKNANGRAIVEEIESVVSVDIVTNPATTRGLSEGIEPVKKTFKQTLVEILAGDVRRLALIEDMPPATADAPPAPIPAGAAVEDPLDKAFADALHAAVDSYAAGDTDSAGFFAKIKEISKYWEKMSPAAGAGAATPPAGGAAGGAGSPTPIMAGADPLTIPDGAALLREELAIRDLIEEAGLTFTKPAGRKVFIRSLIPLTEAERTELIEERKGQQAAKPGQQQPPPKPAGARSAAPVKAITEGTGGAGSKPQTRDDVISAFRR